MNFELIQFKNNHIYKGFYFRVHISNAYHCGLTWKLYKHRILFIEVLTFTVFKSGFRGFCRQRHFVFESFFFLRQSMECLNISNPLSYSISIPIVAELDSRNTNIGPTFKCRVDLKRNLILYLLLIIIFFILPFQLKI